MSAVAVFDVGKTNVKLMAVSADGHLLDKLETPNPVYPVPPYAHHDLGRLERWLLTNLAALGMRHDIEAIVTRAGHNLPTGGAAVEVVKRRLATLGTVQRFRLCGERRPTRLDTNGRDSHQARAVCRRVQEARSGIEAARPQAWRDYQRVSRSARRRCTDVTQ